MTGPHLDDDALSALVDGDGSPADREHMASCPACQAGLVELSAVARVIGTPVPPVEPGQLDAAVARAMAAWRPLSAPDPSTGVAAFGEGEPEPDVGAGAPLGPRRRGASSPVSVGSRPSRRPGVAAKAAAMAPWLAGVAAVAAVVVALSLVVGRVHHGPTTASSAKAAASTTIASQSRPQKSAAAAPAVAAPPLVLGEQSDPAAVVRLITAALASQSSSTTSAAVARPVAQGAPSSSGALPVGGACVASARAALGPAATGASLELDTPLTWRDQPAVAVVFAASSQQLGAILGAPSCQLLVVLPF